MLFHRDCAALEFGTRGPLHSPSGLRLSARIYTGVCMRMGGLYVPLSAERSEDVRGARPPGKGLGRLLGSCRNTAEHGGGHRSGLLDWYVTICCGIEWSWDLVNCWCEKTVAEEPGLCLLFKR